MRKKNKNYIYTNKKHSELGMFATGFALISFVFLIVMLVISYKNSGVTTDNFGVTTFFCMLFSIAGIILGFVAKSKKDTFLLFPLMGIIWNVIDLLMISGILYAGI